MDLDGLTIYAGHDKANRQYSGSYYNNCKVKYFKHFAGQACTNNEINKFADCSADKCAELANPPSCSADPILEGASPLEHEFKDTNEYSGYAMTTMGWINCANRGGSYANAWHMSPDNNNGKKHPGLLVHMGNRYLYSYFTR